MPEDFGARAGKVEGKEVPIYMPLIYRNILLAGSCDILVIEHNVIVLFGASICCVM